MNISWFSPLVAWSAPGMMVSSAQLSALALPHQYTDRRLIFILYTCLFNSIRNVIQQIAILSSISISPILQLSIHAADVASSSVSITSATVRQNGLPVLTTSAGQGYTYHEGMKTWVKVIDPWFAISSFFGTDPMLGSRDSFGDITPSLPQRKGVLSHLQAAATGGRQEKDAAFAQELLNVEESVQNVVTLTHLEVSITPGDQVTIVCIY